MISFILLIGSLFALLGLVPATPATFGLTDVNNDGVITADEFAQVECVFISEIQSFTRKHEASSANVLSLIEEARKLRELTEFHNSNEDRLENRLQKLRRQLQKFEQDLKAKWQLTDASHVKVWDAHQTTEMFRKLSDGGGDEGSDDASEWVLEHDNMYCFGGKQLTTSLAGFDGGARDAAKCGSLAANDNDCNPLYVHVRKVPPFNDCFCATADNMCVIQGNDDAFAVFRKQTTLSPTELPTSAPTAVPIPAPTDDAMYALGKQGTHTCDNGRVSIATIEECEMALTALDIYIVKVWDGYPCYKDAQGNGYANGQHHTGAYFICKKIACPAGYIFVDGDIPGGDAFGRGYNNRKDTIEECRDDCDGRGNCLSFEYSHSEHQCFLNLQSQPSTSRYLDYLFCSKDVSPCDEASWPDKDHGLICGECKVLVNRFSEQYKSCSNYCAAVGRTCTGAWEEISDTCNVMYDMTCDQTIASSDAICECKEEASHDRAIERRGVGGCGGSPYLREMTGSFDQCSTACVNNVACIKFQRHGNTCWLSDASSKVQQNEPTGNPDWECGFIVQVECSIASDCNSGMCGSDGYCKVPCTTSSDCSSAGYSTHVCDNGVCKATCRTYKCTTRGWDTKEGMDRATDPTESKCCETKYKSADRNTEYCPSGFSKLHSTAECRAACKSLGWEKDGHGDRHSQPQYPSGCIENGLHCYWNGASSGKPNPSRSPVCINVGTPVPTAVPTLAPTIIPGYWIAALSGEIYTYDWAASGSIVISAPSVVTFAGYAHEIFNVTSSGDCGHGFSQLYLTGSLSGNVVNLSCANQQINIDSLTFSICDEGEVEVAGSSRCTQCPGGKTSDTPRKTCTPCGAGKFSTSGSSACEMCEAGKYSSLAATTCNTCENGEVPNDYQSACLQCEAGTKASIGDSACTACDAGKYNDAPMQSGCLACPLGTFSKNAGMTACAECTVGTYSALPGMTTCLACSSGTFSEITGSTACVECALGSSARLRGASTCLQCPLGTFSNVVGMTACAECAPGRYADSVSTTMCVYCPYGTVSESIGMTACAACAVGTYSGLEGTTACKSCGPGMFSNVPMSLTCEPCRLGTFSSTVRATACESCSPGSYNDELGNASCSACPKGKHSGVSMQATCEPCPLGRFTASTGTSQCHRCPDARMTTMSKVLVHGGQEQWAYRDGATNESWCGCDKQTRMSDAGSCIDCEEGVDCVGMGEFFIKSGYAAEAMENGQLSVFKCHGLEVRCKGGAPGETCAEGREGVSCALCMRMRTPSADGTCAECGQRDMFPLVLACMGGFCLLILMYGLVATTNKAKQSPWLVLCGMSCSILITGMQQLSIVRMVPIQWPARLVNVFDVFSIIAIDLELIRLHCVASTSSLGIFSGKLCMIGAGVVAVIVIHVGFVRIFRHGRFREHSPSLRCGLGLFAMVLYISVTGTVLEPLQCLPNPNGKKTVSGYQAVVCWQTDEHVMMASVGIMALLVPVLYLVHCTVAVNRFPRKMIEGDTRFLRMYMFLFYRYRKEMYWYAPVHMFRSLLLSITPTIPSPVGQLVLMQILTLAHMIGTIYLVPWRLELANLLEAIVVTLILLVLTVACLLVEETPVFEIVCLGIAVICTIAAAALLMIFYALISYISKRSQKAFDYFLCHHKAGAGCFVRLLRLHLSDMNCSAFLDSDDLSDLDRLFDYVASDTKSLIVVCSRDILLRPWCVGEIVTGMLHRVKTVQVILKDFVMPSDEFIEQYGTHVGDLSILSSRGIDMFMIQEGMRWLLACHAFELPPYTTKCTMDSLVSKLTGLCVKGTTVERRVTLLEDMFPNDAQVVILNDHSNFEINACAVVLVKLLVPHVVMQPELTPHILPEGGVLPVVTEILIILCTNGVFQRPYFLRALLTAAERPSGCFHVPVVAEANFRFPTKHILEDKDIRDTVSSVCEDEEGMLCLILDVFKAIALDFQPERTEDMLRIQAAEIAKRLTIDYAHSRKGAPLPFRGSIGTTSATAKKLPQLLFSSTKSSMSSLSSIMSQEPTFAPLVSMSSLASDRTSVSKQVTIAVTPVGKVSL